MSYYIINLVILFNLCFFFVELLHIVNNIDLIITFVCLFSFYFLFYFLSFAFNNYYISYIYIFFFKYMYILFLLKKVIKLLFNISKNTFKLYYYIVFVLKYYLYSTSLSSLFFLEFMKNNYLSNIYRSFGLKKKKNFLLGVNSIISINRSNFFF